MGLLDDPNSNFAPMAAAVAGGAQAFTQAYGARQQQVHTMQMQDQELAMKKEYYNLQMQKLKQKVEPTSVDINNVMTKAYQYKALNELASSGKISQEDLNKQLTDYINGIETPGEANLAAKILSGGNKNVSPKEGQMITSLIGQGQVADRIAMQERTAGMKIKSAEQIAQEKRMVDLQNQNMDYLAKLKELGYKDEVLGETKRTNQAKEEIARQRNKILLNRPKAGPAAKTPPEQTSLLRQIENQQKAMNGFAKDMMVGNKTKAAAQEDLNDLYDSYQQKYGVDLRPKKKEAAAPSAGPAPMGGQGPLRVYESAERQKAPVGAVVKNSQGKLFKKTATGYLPIK